MDYDEYLSIDNGKGVLISKYSAYILEKFHIDYCNCSSLSELIFIVSQVLSEDYDEDLENVLNDLSERHYYQEVNK